MYHNEISSIGKRNLDFQLRINKSTGQKGHATDKYFAMTNIHHGPNMVPKNVHSIDLFLRPY